MQTFALALKALAPLFVIVAVVHLTFGVRADEMLGASVGPAVVAEPTLDSQNRFYGVAFSLYGVLLYLCATDLERYEPILKAVLACFFLGGVARLVSWATHGAPAPLVVVLAATELLLPLVLFGWHLNRKSVGQPGA